MPPISAAEYAVYVITDAAKGLSERAFQANCRVPNLDAPPICPYTSAVPEMDVFLTLGAAPL